MSGNPRRTGSSDQLAKLYDEARELRLKQLKDLASPAITAYFLERHCQLAQNLLGVSEPSRDPEGKVTDPDELQVHRRWTAYLISAKNGWLTKQDRDWIKKNALYLPPSTRDVLENRMRKDAEPANAPGAKTTNLDAIAAATANPDPAPADSAPAGTTEPPPDGQTDALPASNKADVTDERPLTVPKKPIDPLMVAIFALIVIVIGVTVGRGVARSRWFSPSPVIATRESPPTPAPTVVVQPTPVPAVVQPAPAPAPVQPPAVVAQLRPLRASDVNVTDLRHVRDGQIPFSLRLEHMQCATPPRRNPDNTVDFSACQWVEMRPVRR